MTDRIECTETITNLPDGRQRVVLMTKEGDILRDRTYDNPPFVVVVGEPFAYMTRKSWCTPEQVVAAREPIE